MGNLQFRGGRCDRRGRGGGRDREVHQHPRHLSAGRIRWLAHIFPRGILHVMKNKHGGGHTRSTNPTSNLFLEEGIYFSHFLASIFLRSLSFLVLYSSVWIFLITKLIFLFVKPDPFDAPNLSVENGDSEASLEWDHANCIEGYEVRVCQEGNMDR